MFVLYVKVVIFYAVIHLRSDANGHDSSYSKADKEIKTTEYMWCNDFAQRYKNGCCVGLLVVNLRLVVKVKLPYAAP